MSEADTLEIIGGQIRARLQKSEDQRVSAGLLILEAKRRIEAGEKFELTVENDRDRMTGAAPTWPVYCRLYIRRSDRDIRRLIAIASSPDPEAARAAEKQRNRDAKPVGSRARTGASPGRHSDIDPIAGVPAYRTPAEIADDIRALTPEDFAAHKAWFLGFIGAPETPPKAAAAEAKAAEVQSEPPRSDIAPAANPTPPPVPPAALWAAQADKIVVPPATGPAEHPDDPPPSDPPSSDPPSSDPPSSDPPSSKLMAAFLEIPSTGQADVRDWILRGIVQGQNPPANMPDDFASLWAAADDATRQTLRRELLGWKPARMAA